MGRTRPPDAPTVLGAWGLVLALALGSIDALAAGGGASAGARAQRLQPPAAAAPSVDSTLATVVAMTNEARAAAGVAAVAEDARLDAAAAGHSADQAAHQTMSHIGTDGSTCGQRLTAAGYAWRTWGENVAAGQTSAAQVVQAWLNSPGHRVNMLNPAFTGIGVGVVAGSNGVLYWTMDLAA